MVSVVFTTSMMVRQADGPCQDYSDARFAASSPAVSPPALTPSGDPPYNPDEITRD
jgi:hypothetical protein